MNSLKILFKTSALAVVLAAGATAATISVASADTACNSEGDCWHVSQRYSTYPKALGIKFYSDDWRTSHQADTHYHWRDDPKDDHGYYDRGEWHAFEKDHSDHDHD